MANGAVNHSYIFHGPKNIGKDTVARWFASELLKTPAEKLSIHPDFFEIQPDGVISKEQVDSVIERVKLTSWSGGYKVMLIGDAHSMNISSSNAFLKTLEEPPQKTVIILFTSELGKILPTIISRSAIVHFRPVAKDDIRQFLKDRHNCADAKNVANLSCGRPGRAISALANPDEINYAPKVEEFYKLFFSPIAERFAAVNGMFGKKNDENKQLIREKIDFWLEIIRDACFFKYNLHDNVIFSGTTAALEKISRAKTASDLAILGGKLIKMRGLVSNNINIKLMLENLII